MLIILCGRLGLIMCVCIKISLSNLCGCFVVFGSICWSSVSSVRDMDDVVVTDSSSSLDGDE